MDFLLASPNKKPAERAELSGDPSGFIMKDGIGADTQAGERENIYHQTGSSENHRLKSAKR